MVTTRSAQEIAVGLFKLAGKELPIKLSESKSQFFIPGIGLNEQAFIAFQRENGQTLHLYHTQVSTNFQGTGMASALAKTAFDYVVKNGLKMRISCEYLQHQLDKASNVQYDEARIRE